VRDLITTLLDLTGLVLLAAGLGFAAGLLLGWAALAVTGLVLLAGSRVIVWVSAPQAAPVWWRSLANRGGERG
jgi:hypothetical protein